MRVLVVSDSHGDYFNLSLALEQQRRAECVFHLGDGERECDELYYKHPEKKFFRVRGNCDFGSSLPQNTQVCLEGKHIFATHGYGENVKYGLITLSYKAKEKGADIVLYGHTHCPSLEYENGMIFMNPGSVKDGKYGIIDIQPDGTVVPCLMQII